MTASPERPAVLVVMGVTSSGKTTIATMLAARLGWPFRDGDTFHPPANVAKMSAGTPLTDEDRWPWLGAIAAWIDEARGAGTHAIVTCSALKRSYRAVLLGGRPDVRLVFLSGSPALIEKRMAARVGHYMPRSLLESQIETLETPAPDENPLTVSIDASPDAIVDEIMARLKAD